jgi:hypothetical protein
MRVARYALGAVLVVSLLAGSAAFAAHLTTSSNKLAAGSAVVASCDANTTNWNYGTYTTNANGLVTTFTVSNINSHCNGRTLTVSTTDGSGNNLSGGSCMVTAGSCSVSLSTAEPPANIVKLYGVVIGP